MDGAVNPASIALSISIGTAVLAGIFSSWIAMRSCEGVPANRDTAVSILFGIAGLLILLTGAASALIVVSGTAFVGLFEAALLLTAACAVAGMVFGLVRGLRSGRAVKTESTSLPSKSFGTS